MSWRNAKAVLAVLVGTGAVIAVPATVNALISDDVTLMDGRPVDVGVGVGVTLSPPAGSRLSLSDSVPAISTVLLRHEGATLEVTAVSGVDRPADFLAHARRKLRREGMFTVRLRPVVTRAGVLGERGDLVPVPGGVGVSGCYAGFVADERGIVVKISNVSECRAVPPLVWVAVESITVAPEEEW
ncbi:hypothetical protein [Pilimelia columellifera]|uniref:Uncharacterized protein n=1 Tax=Pilimelia columellifera subsp. columellifera TaxID=706583 RepID=A0ABP6AM84_9ACTN